MILFSLRKREKTLGSQWILQGPFIFLLLAWHLNHLGNVANLDSMNVSCLAQLGKSKLFSIPKKLLQKRKWSYMGKKVFIAHLRPNVGYHQTYYVKNPHTNKQNMTCSLMTLHGPTFHQDIHFLRARIFIEICSTIRHSIYKSINEQNRQLVLCCFMDRYQP